MINFNKITNKKLYNLIFSIFIFVSSAMLFILVPNKDKYFWTSYLFTLIAIGAVYSSGLIIINGNLRNIVANVALVPTAYQYLIAELAITLAFGVFLKLNYTIYVCLHIAVFTGFLIKFLILLMGRNYVVNLSKKTREKVVNLKFTTTDIELLIQQAFNLNANIKDNVVNMLSDLQEKVKYSDPMIHDNLTELDDSIKANILKIKEKINKLIDSNSDDITELEKLVANTVLLVSDRNRKVLILK